MKYLNITRGSYMNSNLYHKCSKESKGGGVDMGKDLLVIFDNGCFRIFTP